MLNSSSFLTSSWPSEVTASDKTFAVREGYRLFVFHHTVQRNFGELRSTTCEVIIYKICSVLKGGIQDLKTCHGSQQSNTCKRKRAIANMQSDHADTRELRYVLVREIGECFQLIDKLTFLLFDTSLNHGRAEEGR